MGSNPFVAARVSDWKSPKAHTCKPRHWETRPHSSMALSASPTWPLVKSQPRQGSRPVDCAVRFPIMFHELCLQNIIEWLLSNGPCCPRRIVVRTSLLLLQGLRTSGVTVIVVIYFLCHRRSGWVWVTSQSSFNLLD